MDPYLIPGTATLRNRRGITDPLELEQFDADVSTLRIHLLLDGSVLLHGRWDLPHLLRVHRHIFGDVYAWAGEIRTIALRKADQVHPVPSVEHADDIFGRLARDRQLSGLERPAFISKVSQVQADLFALHPFRDGNTRATTTFVGLVARHAGWNVAWRDANVAGVQVLLRYAYEARGNETGRRLEPLFESIVTPLQRHAADAEPHTAQPVYREQTARWEDEARELHRQTALLVTDSDRSAQRSGHPHRRVIANSVMSSCLLGPREQRSDRSPRPARSRTVPTSWRRDHSPRVARAAGALWS